ADDENAGVLVFRFDVLAQLVKRPIDVLLLAGEKGPTRTSVKLPAVLFEARRRIRFRIDRDGNEKSVLAETVAKRFLDLFEVAIHRRTNIFASGEEGVD